MKAGILHIQRFFSEQMQRHGYGSTTFQIEIDEGGEPLVHRVDGKNAEVHYSNDTLEKILDEMGENIDPYSNIYLIVIDNSSNLIGNYGRYSGGTASRVGKSGGVGVFPVANIEWGSWITPAHELGHAFGLEHDFNDDAYIMSYGDQGEPTLSMCNAGIIAVHPYFDFNVPLEDSPPPTIELLSGVSYSPRAKSVPVQVEIASSIGLHQVTFFVMTRNNPYRSQIDYAAGSLEVLACLGSGEKEAVFDFDFDGIIPSGSLSNLSESEWHVIGVEAVDAQGNVGRLSPFLKRGALQQIRSFSGGQFVAYSPDGTTLASASREGTIKLWNASTGEETATFEGGGFAAFSPEGSILASATSTDLNTGFIKLWDISTRTEISSFQRDGSRLVSAAFSPDGKTIAFGTSNNVELWDVESGQNYATLEHTGWVERVTFSSDGSILASAALQRDVKLWDLETYENVTLEGDGPMALSPNGSTLVYSTGNKIVLWDIASEQDIGTITPIRPSSTTVRPLSLAIAPDEATLAIGHDFAAILIWDLKSGKNLGELWGEPEYARSLAFSPEGTELASGLEGGTVEIFDVSEWTTPRPGNLVKISGDEQQGPAGSRLDQPFLVEVRDQRGNPLPGVQVTVTVQEGGGKLGTRFTVVKTTTDGDGRAESMLTLGAEPGTNIVEVSVPGVEGISFSALGTGTSTAVMDGEYHRWHLPQGAVFRLGKGPIGSRDRALSFSPDGQALAVASDLGIWIYDSANLNPTALLPGGLATTLAFSPDGRTLVSGSGWYPVNLWDVETGQLTGSLDNLAESLAFSPDGTILATGSNDYKVRLWDVATGTNTATLPGHQAPVLTLAFSPDGRTLASGSEEYVIKLWEVETGHNTATLSFGEKDRSGFYVSAHSVAFSPDGAILASVFDGDVILWDVAAETHSATLSGHTDFVGSVTFSPDGATLASGSGDGTAKLWDLSTGETTATFSGDVFWGNSVAFSPDGATLAFGSRHDDRIGLWDVATGNAAFLSGHTDRIRSVAFSPDGTIIASGSIDGSIKLWDVSTGTRTATLSGHGRRVNSLAFSPDGDLLASGSHDGLVKLWEVATGTNTATLSGHSDIVRPVVFSPDGTLLASGSNDRTVKLWEVATEANTATLEGFGGRVRSLAFSPDGSLLASGSDDGLVKLWDIATRSNTAILEGHTGWVHSVAFSPDGIRLASGAGDRMVKLWDVATRENTATLTGHDDWVSSVSFAPEGMTLVSGSADNTVKLWDVGTGRNTATLAGHYSWVNAVSLSPGGTILASASQDGTVLLWDMELVLPNPRALAKGSGDDQQGPAGTALAEPFVVTVLDQYGDPFAGATVTFAVTAGGGTLSATTASTDADGRAAATLTLGSQLGANTVTASVADLDPVTFTATAEATPDFDGDGETGFSDFFLFADAFGGSDPRFDLDGSGTVDFADFFILADHFADPARGKLLALARERIGLPDGPQLQQNAPNPFNSQTVISWFQLRPGPARVEVFALTGQRVAVLHQGPKKAGVHRVRWEGRDDRGRPLASGVYLYRLVTDESVRTRKLTLLR